jgi:hypothetical protein
VGTVSVPYTAMPGQPYSASGFNQNFQVIVTAINGMQPSVSTVTTTTFVPSLFAGASDPGFSFAYAPQGKAVARDADAVFQVSITLDSVPSGAAGAVTIQGLPITVGGVGNQSFPCQWAGIALVNGVLTARVSGSTITLLDGPDNGTSPLLTVTQLTANTFISLTAAVLL